MGLADKFCIWLNLIIAPILKIDKIPSTKIQIPNKYQHAAQAPALRLIEIKNPKQKNLRAASVGTDMFRSLELAILILFDI